MSPRAGLVALFVANTISALGSRVSFVAIPWLVLTSTGDPAKMGLVIVAQTIPYLLSGIFLTPLAERLGIKRSAVLTDLVSVATTAAIAAIPGIGVPTLIVLSAAEGSVRGAGDRTKHVLLRPMAEAAGLGIKRMTAVHDGLGNAATLIGAPVGGLLVYWLGAQGAIWTESGASLITAAMVITLVHPPAELLPKPEAKPEPYLVALRGGARQLLRDRLLLSMLLMAFFANAVNQAHTALFVPLWIEQKLHSPAALGTVFAAFSAGAVLGNLVFIAIVPRLPQYLTFTICLAISGAPRLFVLGLSDNLALVLGVTFMSGLAVSAVNPILGAVLFERVPNEMQTRVFGLVATVTYAGYPVGGVLGGWGVSAFGLTTSVLFGGVVYLLATMVPLARHRAGDAVQHRRPDDSLA